MKIYVASSWRNPIQPEVVGFLREWGHEVYDFKDADGFRWSEIDPQWEAWTPERYRQCLDHPLAIKGFNRDMDALRSCDACVLVLPSGRSAHLELGWAVGAGKKTAVLLSGRDEPELMNKMVDLVTDDIEEIGDWLLAMTKDGRDG